MKRIALITLLTLLLPLRILPACAPDTESHTFAGYGTHGQCTYFDMTSPDMPIVEDVK